MNRHEAISHDAAVRPALEGIGPNAIDLVCIENGRIEIGRANKETRGTCGTRLDAVFNLQAANGLFGAIEQN